MRYLLGLARVALVTACAVVAIPAGAATYDERSAGGRALYTTLAVVANVTPVVSALYAPQCLPGYVLCKASFAAVSVVAAGAQLFLSGGDDWGQTRAIIHRGFAGDWYLTGRHTAGDVKPQPLPDPGPPADAGEEYMPPPI